jgi:uncharacterized membrane protein YoaK (UPF0700 family)
VAIKAIPVPGTVAALLAFVAGVVDACTVFALFGLFVAQVTGSFVLIGVQIVHADIVNVVRTLAIPLFFLAGFATVFLAELASDSKRALCWTLFAEFGLVTGFVLIGLIAPAFDHPNAPWALAASLFGVAAMGVQSALVRLLMRGVASTNVMTTNTTLASIELAQWLIASRRLAKHPGDSVALELRREARGRFAGLWPVLVGFLAGAICGAVGFRWTGFYFPLSTVAILAGLLVWAMRSLNGTAGSN